MLAVDDGHVFVCKVVATSVSLLKSFPRCELHILLDGGAQVNAYNYAGMTALH